ncbi:hypothetical protein AO286_13235 [Pseudomonas syringae]|uniref:hypothetical protein n=1 Tax=Pseudomonas syringae TaxID=317 RepID=UPI000C07B5A5|nr:hypothetical protein [Pseudomonas syringae]PHN53753.1 hypothetical protein AO286_13235 [Pseudomonas syringae]
MVCLITGAEQFDTRIRVAQKKKATEWLKLFSGSISQNYDSWMLGCLDAWMLGCLDAWMLTLKVENEVFYAGFIVRPGGYSKFKVVDAAVLMSMALESKGVA